MKFLADMGISPRSAAFLRSLGYDTIHLENTKAGASRFYLTEE